MAYSEAALAFSQAFEVLGNKGSADDRDNRLLSDNSLSWMIKEVDGLGLTIEPHLSAAVVPQPLADINQSRTGFYRVRKEFARPIDYKGLEVRIHRSVRTRWDNDPTYRPKELVKYVNAHSWPPLEQ